MRGSATISVGRPIQDAWALAADLERLGAWMRGVRDVRRVSLGDLGAGSMLEAGYGERGARFAFEVVEWEPPRRRTIRSTEGPFPLTASLELEGEGRLATRVLNVTDAGKGSLASSLIAPLIRRRMERDLRAELRAFRDLVEQR